MADSISAQDSRRIAALRRLNLLDTPAEAGFDRLTRLAAVSLGVPAAFISLVDEGRDFYLSQFGFEEPVASLRQFTGETLCHKAIRSEVPLAVYDTRGNPEYREIPTVDALGIGAYLGIPLRLSNGLAIGAFCAIDHEPRHWSEAEIGILRELAALTMDAIELRVDRGRYLDLVEELDAIVWEMDATTSEFTFVSQRAEDMLGYSPVRWLTEPDFWADVLVHPEDRVMAINFRIMSTDGEPYNEMEYRAVTSDGRLVWLQDRVRMVADDDDLPRLLRGVMVDITAQRQITEALASSEEQFRQLAASIDVVFWLYDFGVGRTIYVSPAYKDIWDREPSELYEDSRPWADAIHPDDRERVLSNMDVTREAEYQIEYRIVRPDGEIRWIEDRGFPIRNQAGEVYRTAGVAEDVTSQRRTAEALRESEKKFRQIAENVHELFWIFSPDFSEAIYISPAYETLWGRSLESVYGQPSTFLDAVHPEDLGALREAMQHVGQDVFDGIEYRIIQPDGTVRWMFSSGFPVRDERGEVTRVVGTTADITNRRRAEAELQQSEDRFRAIFEQSSAAIMIHDNRGKILQVNERICESLGYSRDELQRMKVTAIQVGTDPTVMLTSWAQVYPGAAQMIAGVHRRKDGSTFPVEVRIRGISLGGKSLILSEAHDVIERRQAEEKLAFAEAHYRRLVETAPQTIYALDAEGRFIELNPAGERLLERAAEDVMGHHYSTVITRADLDVATDGFERVISGEEYSIAFEERIRRPSGEERLLHITETAVIEGGVITGTHGIAWDITEERADQEQMRLLATALENLDEGVSIARFDGQLIFANAAHARLLGHDLQKGSMSNIQEFLPDDESKGQFQEAMRIAAERGTWTGRVLWQRIDDGTRIALEVILGRVDREEGESLLFTIARDIGEDLKKEQYLRRAERLASVGTLIGGVAHELNNPLHAIRTFAELMLMEERGEEDLEALEIIRREADRAAKVVLDLRLAARQTQEDKSEKQPVDLNEVALHVLKLREYALQTGNIEVREDLAQDLPPVLADRSQIEQVVLNLVVNAEQAMTAQADERRLILRTRAADAGVTLQIVDSGIGIPQNYLERIFDPFFTTKPPGEGTGLGLSLVHSIVEEHGGEIRVDSEQGNGTAFRLSLPRAADTAHVAEGGASHAEAAVRSLRILVVDDEHAIRRGFSRYLTRRGHKVQVAADGEEALRLLETAGENEIYDIILSDLRMPGLGGDQLLSRLRAQGKGLDLRVVLLTGDAASGTAARILADANVPVLYKPIKLDEAALVIERHAENVGSRSRDK